MDTLNSDSPTMLPIWGGVECTVNRIGDRYRDQLVLTGHHHRLDDLDRIAALGIRTLRYPILWERTAPAGLDRADWSWSDQRLGRLRELGITPIVTLVHHGSGPPSTNLLDPSFVDGLAGFAAAVAARYPWITDFTPVNEPLTTARFSALYGHWHPHARDPRLFVRALLHECLATAAAMRAIRRVTPDARLVQTEDIGRTTSTPRLAYQAAFENERRWLSLDLLFGHVRRGHPLDGYLRWLDLDRATAAGLDRLAADPCPPDLIGLNYYVTSDRFLDERLDRYPGETHGGNDRARYADVEAVRVAEAEITGIGPLLAEAAARYGRPIAVTECHLGGAEEERIRWLAEIHAHALAARRAGVDLRALTVWSLFGAVDWHCLLCYETGHYEPGVFDAHADPPRPTVLAAVVRDLAAGRPPRHPALQHPGWWRRPNRVLYRDVSPPPAFWTSPDRSTVAD